MYRFRFTAVRTGPYDGVQLGAIALLDTSGALLPVEAVANPGGSSPRAQGPERLLGYQSSPALSTVAATQSSNTGKWFDGNFDGNVSRGSSESVLELTLSAAATVGGYHLMTANDVPR